MSKKLYLLRHAQSADKQHGQVDKERELTAQGRLDATKIGRAIKKLNINFDLVISSTASRAKSTTLLVAAAIQFDTKAIEWSEEIYETAVQNLIMIVGGIDNTLDSVLLVGHNPTISYCAAYLSGTDRGDLAPGCMAILHFSSTDWKEVKQNTGKFVSLMDPSLLD